MPFWGEEESEQAHAEKSLHVHEAFMKLVRIATESALLAERIIQSTLCYLRTLW
jgi:hypothetical protein